MPSTFSHIALTAGLALATFNLIDAVMRATAACLPETWPQATLLGVLAGLFAWMLTTALASRRRQEHTDPASDLAPMIPVGRHA